jgi:hypothetical protein
MLVGQVKFSKKVKALVFKHETLNLNLSTRLKFDDKPGSVGWNLRLQLPGGRRELRCYLRWCWWPVNGGAKAVKKEKLFERREIELWLRVLVPDRLRNNAPYLR